MRILILAPAALAAAALATSGVARAQSVSFDYTDDFSYPTPSTGWSYLWNATGPVGSSANYSPLVADFPASGRYEAIANATYPEPPGPAGATAATATTLIPGRGTSPVGQDGNTVSRFVLAAYTIQPQDLINIGLPASGTGFLEMSDYSFAVALSSQDGITAQLYKNDTLFLSQGLPPGVVFDVNTPGPRSGPIPLGPFQAGDTFYVAIGADPADPAGDPFPGNDVGDGITLDYTLTLSVPEPAASLGAIAFAGAAALRRRRRV